MSCLAGVRMILGKNGKFKGKGYVCFIDVLGFSNDIIKNWNNSESDPLKKILSIKWDFETDGYVFTPGISSINKEKTKTDRNLQGNR